MEKKKLADFAPTIEQLQAERERLKYRSRYSRTLKSTIAVLVVVAAITVLVSTIWMPVIRIYGNSMTPTLQEGEIVFSLKGSKFECGNIIGLHYGNKLLVKRVIAGPGQWVDIDAEGNVYVDGEALNEPYITDKSYGDVNINLPYQVPEGKYFVMGDHRNVSADSRNTAVGCVTDEQIVGRILFRVWPVESFGLIE